MTKSLSKQFHGLFRPPAPLADRRKDAGSRLNKVPKGPPEKGPAGGGGGLDHYHHDLQSLFQQQADQRSLVELRPNPSPFAVFAAIRGCVQEAERRLGTGADKTGVPLKPDQDSSLTDDSKVVPLPRLVVMGIHGMLDVIRESSVAHPELCARALRGLFNTLQGLSPEAMRDEPRETIDKLFSLMLELSSMSIDVPATLSSLASAGLISLAIASGETAKLLAAANCLLLTTSPDACSPDRTTLPTPLILIGLQRSIQAMLMGTAGSPLPRWFSLGVPPTPIASFRIDIPSEAEPAPEAGPKASVCCLSSDGRFLYLLQAGVLYKVTNGFGDSVEGNVLVMNRHLCKSEGVVWVGVVADELIAVAIRSDIQTSEAAAATKRAGGSALILDKDTLQVTQRLSLASGVTIPLINTLFSDGQSVNCIVHHEDMFSIQTVFRPSVSASETEEQPRGSATSMLSGGDSILKLTKKSMLVYGQGAITAINKGEFNKQPAGPAPIAGAGDGRQQQQQQLQQQAQVQQQAHQQQQQQQQNEQLQSVVSQDESTRSPNLLNPALDLGCDGGEEADMVSCGNDFALVRGNYGTVWVGGRVSALGVKQGTERWHDMRLTAKRVAVGHDGSHAVFLAPDGTVWFAGTARRGEDGEPVKGKRQPKTTKPRKITKLEGVEAVDVACNNGTTAVVTAGGDLLMFGKDAAGHTEPNTGLIVGVKDVMQVCLGKAHVVAVTHSGTVYTFGVNHKGQCARELAAGCAGSATDTSEVSITAASSADSLVDVDGSSATTAIIDQEREKTPAMVIPMRTSEHHAMPFSGGNVFGNAHLASARCPPHQFSTQDCRICTACLQCTGYGQECIASMKFPSVGAQRLPGSLCGCGVGDGGCIHCGCCRTCCALRESSAPSAAAPVAPVPGVGHHHGHHQQQPNLHSHQHHHHHHQVAGGQPASLVAASASVGASAGSGGSGAAGAASMTVGGSEPVGPPCSALAGAAVAASAANMAGGPMAAACEQNQKFAAPVINALQADNSSSGGPGEGAAVFRKNSDRIRRREESSPSYSRLARERERERERSVAAGDDAAAGVGGAAGIVGPGRRYHPSKPFSKVVSRETLLLKSGNDVRLSGAVSGVLNGGLNAGNGLRVGVVSREDLSALVTANCVTAASGTVPGSAVSSNGPTTGAACLVGTPASINGPLSGNDLDGGKLASLPPVKLNISHKVVQAATGVHHTVLLLENGSVLTFGSNQHGQLGHGNRSLRGAPAQLQGLPQGSRVIQVAAGSNHTVLLLSNGSVYTCGNPLNGQLCRSEEDSGVGSSSSEAIWHAIAGPVPAIGAPSPRRATWIGASGDHTFIRIDESLIDARCLFQARVAGTRQLIAVVPDSESGSEYSSLMMQRSNGQCRGHPGPHPIGSDDALSFDPVYSVLWSYKRSTSTVNVYHVVPGTPMSATVPSQSEFEISRQHAALSLVKFVELAALHPPDSADDLAPGVGGQGRSLATGGVSRAGIGPLTTAAGGGGGAGKRSFAKDDYLVVNRFDSHGGGWGYSGHSIEAIRFMCDSDIILGGVGLFGGRGEYTAKLRILDLGEEGGDQEGEGELLADLQEQTYECPARQKHPLLLDTPIACQANRWYLVWARITGPSSDCGSLGQPKVVTEDQVTFYFKGSKRSNNGTDTNAGQIPQLLYRLASPDAGQNGTGQLGSMPGSDDTLEAPTYVLSREFAMGIDAGCFQSLLTLIEWIWKELQKGPCVIGERLSEPVLSLLRQYVSQVHPQLAGTTPAALEPLCRSLWLCRKLLKRVLITGAQGKPALEHFVTECSVTFLHCYQTFYPTDALKWQGLGELLLHDQKTSDVRQKKRQQSCSAPGAAITGKPPRNHSRLLSAILDALSSAPPSLLASMVPHQLTKVVLHERPASSSGTGATAGSLPASPMSSNFNNLPSTRNDCSEVPVLFGKLLSDAMSVRDDGDLRLPGTLTFGDVVDRLIQIGVNPLGILLASDPNSTDASGGSSRGAAASAGTVSNSITTTSTGGSGTTCSSSSSSSSVALPAELVHNACRLLAAIIAELAARVVAERRLAKDRPGGAATGAPNPLVTPSRFQRLQHNRTWNTGNGSPDAICFSVDRAGISIAGAVIYGASNASIDWVYELDLQEFVSGSSPGAADLPAERWTPLESVSGNFGPDDCTHEMFEIKFDRAVAIKKNVRYALRLRNHGSKTNNGDSGVSQVAGPDGTTFTFGDCTLSYNGTNHSRGQLPQILYYNTPQATSGAINASGPIASQAAVPDLAHEAVHMTLSISEALVSIAHDYMNKAVGALEDDETLAALESTSFVSLLLPAVFAQLVKIASSDTSAAVKVLNLVKTLLENVVKINKRLEGHREVEERQQVERYYAVVESDHPYKPAAISRYRLQFPDDVHWMSVEFDPKCGTAQPEDYLHVYCASLKGTDEVTERSDIDTEVDPYWLVLKRFSGGDSWPSSSIVLPGNSLLFSLESASEYAKDDKSNNFGFRCQVVGHRMSAVVPNSLAHLEKELAYLAGECCSTLLCQEPIFVHGGIRFDPAVVETFRAFPDILGRGLPLERCPTISEALSGDIPIASDGAEKTFLKDFISTKPDSDGAKLAMWLQPESYVDPLKCELLYNKEELQCGMTSSVTVIVKDQYSKLCTVANLKVEIFVVLLGCGAGQIGPQARGKGDLTFGGLPPPLVDVPYEATIKEKMIYHSITMMKAYEKYSFEELRIMSPVKRQATESLMVGQVGDAYTAHWTPSSVGRYEIKALVDGYPVRGTASEIDQIIEVRELPQGASLSQSTPQARAKMQAPSSMSKIRKFSCKHSQGLRVRSTPSLQGKQIGTVPPGGYITFVDAVQNDDGVWLRLTPECAQQYCRRLSSSQAHETWCLQYNNHLGKSLLAPADDRANTEDMKSQHHHSQPYHQPQLNGVIGGMELPPREVFTRKGPGTYQVVKSGSSGHNIRSRASLRSGPPIGMLVMGNYVTIVEDLVNADGLWLRLSRDSMQHYCATAEGEAWTLAQSATTAGGLGCTYLVLEGEGSDEATSETEETTTTRAEKNSANNSKGLDFSATSQGFFTFGSCTSDHDACSSGSVSPFVFGSLSSTPSTSLHALSAVSEAVGGHEPPEPGARAPQTTPQPPGPPAPSGLTPDDHSKTVLQRWLKNNEDHIAETRARDHFNPVPAELQGVSVKELVKAIGESRANGNGATPPATPPKTSPTPRRRASSPRAAKVFAEQAVTSSHRTPQPVSPQLAKCLQEDMGLTSPVIQRTPSTSPNRSSTLSAPSTSSSSATVVSSIRGSPKRVSPVEALAPSMAQSVRAVFAAVLWSEGLTIEAIRATTDISLNSKGVHPPSIEAVVTQSHRTVHLRLLWNKVMTSCMAVFNSKQTADCSDPGASPLETHTRDRRRRSLARNRPYVATAPNMFGNAAVAAASLGANIAGGGSAPGAPATGRAASTMLASGRPATGASAAFALEGIGFVGSCDMCDVTLHPAVTQHMKAAHPGCGGPSGEKGYNSVGNYCDGWEGNCGDGGTPMTSWFLLCESCRARHKTADAKRRQNQNALLGHCTSSGTAYGGRGLHGARELLSPVDYMEKQKAAMQNALFVLSLSSPWDSGDTMKTTASTSTASSATAGPSAASVVSAATTSAETSAAITGTTTTTTAIGTTAEATAATTSTTTTTATTIAAATAAAATTTESISSAPMGMAPALGGKNVPASGGMTPRRASTNESISNSFSVTSGLEFASLGSLGGVDEEQTGAERADSQHLIEQFAHDYLSQGAVVELLSTERARHSMPPVVTTTNNASTASTPLGPRTFHRSISISIADWRPNRASPDAGPSSSASTTTMVAPASTETRLAALANESGSPPIVQFAISFNADLNVLRATMVEAVRRLTCRVYALEALRWLLHNVSQATCLHDILWCFVSSLSVSSSGGGACSNCSAGGGNNAVPAGAAIVAPSGGGGGGGGGVAVAAGAAAAAAAAAPGAVGGAGAGTDVSAAVAGHGVAPAAGVAGAAAAAGAAASVVAQQHGGVAGSGGGGGNQPGNQRMMIPPHEIGAARQPPGGGGGSGQLAAVVAIAAGAASAATAVGAGSGSAAAAGAAGAATVPTGGHAAGGGGGGGGASGAASAGLPGVGAGGGLPPGAAVGAGQNKEAERGENKDKEEDTVCLCDHPLENLAFACGQQTALPLQTAFHQFLESISLLMAHLRTPSPLQQMAVRCWCFRFSPQDHLFLHSSQVFSNISKILSHAEEHAGANQRSQAETKGIQIDLLKDISAQFEVTTSSRPAMVNSLVDGSTETFWESADEDRNKTKFIQIKALAGFEAHYVAIHVDNTRDVQNRVNHVTFKVGDETSLIKLRNEDVSGSFVGWLGVDTTGRSGAGARVVRVELKGIDNSLRVRQLKVLDKPIPSPNGILTPEVIQHANCEAETLKVFRLLTSQVFGKLISGGAATSSSIDGSNDLKEHMVGILFSRSNLTQLQRQVCAHIVATIKKETQRVRDDWELSLSSSSASQLAPQSDAYCFEMLSMVLALSGSSVGRAYLAQQAGLLRDLFSLLHTGSARVQRQVTSLLRRVLPEVSPQVLASILQVPSLPTEDYSIIGLVGDDEQPEPLDVHRPGILDVLLACIAKAITVQIKTKGPADLGPMAGSSGSGSIVDQGLKRQVSSAVSLATAIHPKDNVGGRWWLRGCSTRKHAQVIIQLIRDMCAGLLTESWARVAKSAIAENIIHLTRLDKRFRVSPQECIRTPTLWLCLASLCVLDKEHVDRLSSGQWSRKDSQQEKPLCENHDDGETKAIILCSECGNLCCECDRFLHLNHRRTRQHSRQVFKEEEDAIKVDLHEGCGRTKLFWLIALADSNTLKAMVEFREQSSVGGNAAVGACRFCKAPLTSSAMGALGACANSECAQHAKKACTKLHPCGHFCGGVLNEETCLPCLHGCQRKELRQDADDMCMICFSEALCCAPVIMLKCGHIFHRSCTEDVIDRRWPGPRITFNFALCPICKAPIEHPLLCELLRPVWELRDDVRRKALMRLEYEGLQANKTLSQHERVSYAMERYAYYVCYKCKKAYFGGEVRCELEAGGAGGFGGDEGYDARELVCGACSDVSSAQMCPKHGADFLEYKCRYCCSVAVFFCFGTTHFCNPCHEDFQRVTNVPKNQLPHCPAGPKLKQLEGDECPLHVKHPPTGEEYALGCGVCRNAHTF